MYQIGRFNTLKIHHVDEEGVWLQADRYHILLPAAEVLPSMKKGDKLTVFLYRDSSGDVVATLKKPQAQVGEFALLKVNAVTHHGAFLDWGLDKDLLVPFSEQPDRMRTGRKYLVKVCLDSRGRTVGTARIDRCLETEHIDLEEGQEVVLTLWEFTELGAKVIINDLYGGLVYQDELVPGRRRGDRLRGYVKRLREDGKIDVTLKKTGAEGVREARETILAALRPEGFLPLHDQSTPAEIKGRLAMSKKLFKKAVGGLYKAGLVELTDRGIRLKTFAGGRQKKTRCSGDRGNAPKDGGF
jgi:predicted RNA-binding protein (virulence factor B family)